MTKSDKNFELWIRKLTDGQKLDVLLRGQRTIMSAQKLDFDMEMQEMFDIKRMAAEATKNTDAFAAFKKSTDDMLAALRATQGDPAEFEAAMAVFEANTAAMAAAAVANTPVAVPEIPVVVPTEGQSAGGARSID